PEWVPRPGALVLSCQSSWKSAPEVVGTFGPFGVCGRRPLAPSHGGSARIVGGTDTLPGTWPWMVSIQKPSQGGYMHICGGSLISSLWVVTAAHCFLDKSQLHAAPLHWKLVIGITQISQPGPDTQERSIKNLVQHEQYVQRTHYNDIALMELNEPVNCTDYIQPACLPDTNVVISALTHCYISGWGRMSSTGEEAFYTSDILQEARVNIIPLELCNSSNWYHKKIHYNNICAGFEQGGIDSCQGDSGGPLMCREGRSERFWVIGATSWGIGCANAQKPGVYTSTQHFLDWIRGITNEEFQKPKRPLHFWTEASPKTSIPNPCPAPQSELCFPSALSGVHSYLELLSGPGAASEESVSQSGPSQQSLEAKAYCCPWVRAKEVFP
uniref:Acrosin n=1 Tax=Salvator merianae TaxID=96440 RepID=A0A8D0E5X2_SALMN